MPRFATIVLAGRPNVGKSSLLNALIGQPLAAVSAKPQMTREPVIGLVTEGDTQLAFVDPPGLLEPSYRLQAAMRQQALDALQRADAILYLHPADEGEPPAFHDLVPDLALGDIPIRTVITKADAHATPGPLAISAHSGAGLDDLLAWCRAQAKPGVLRYPADDIGTQPLRFFVAEYVREAAFEHLEQEVPYAIAVTIDEFREAEVPVYIRATLHVERESQKGIVIGKGGRTIKQLGAAARQRSEAFLGRPVYLDLWVKVWPEWRRSPQALRQLGFPVPIEEDA